MANSTRRTSAFKTFAAFGLILFASHTLKSQVAVDNTLTPEQLVQQVLLGAGVSVSNITCNGQPGNVYNNQLGRFFGVSNFVEFPEALVMGSGLATAVVENIGFEPLTNPVTQDPDLMILANASINDAVILEFDFVPTGDSLMFEYVFGSNEYPGFTCSGFNDAFGFFLSGPGINGPFSNNAINIATIPGTNIPVAVNTINSGVPSGGYNAATCAAANPNFVEDSQYFVNNNPPLAGDINIPGLTVTLTAFATVVCGQTYHIKLAIGDAADGALDSFVWLEAGSFSSNSAIQVNLDIPVGINDSTLYRGCGEALLTFIRPLTGSGVQEIAYLDISGTAINGIDILPILPDSIVFPVGIDTVSFVLTAPFLGTAVGQSAFIVTITNIASDCGGLELTSTFTIYVNDAEPLAIEPGGAFEMEDCNDSVQLTPVLTGGYGEYRFLWSTGSTSPSITVSPGFTTNYFVVVTDTCNAGSVSTSFNVQVPVYPPVIVILPEDITLDVCDVPINVVPQVTGGFGNYTYAWRNLNTNQIISTDPVLDYLIETSTTIRLIVTDDCGATGIDDIEIIVPPVEVIVFLPDIFSASNCLEPILLPAISEGGIGFTTYSWYVDGVQVGQTQDQFFSYHPSMGQQVVIKAEDECGNFAIDSTFVAFNFPAFAVVATPDTSICEETDALLRINATGGSGGFRYEWVQNGETTDTLRVAPRQNTPYDYIITDTCGVRAEGRIRVEIREVLASFEYDPIEYYGVQIRNISRPVLGLTYLWDFGDGATSREVAPKHFFNGTDSYTITLTATDMMGCMDDFSRTTTPPAELFIPSAFSPNGDGINELFKVSGSNISQFQIWIYDRWGRQVFYSNDMTQGWNGSHNNGEYHNNMTLYNYFIRYKGKLEEDTFERTGNIVVIR